MVATPWESPIWPGEPTRFVRLTTNVSLGSSIASPVIGTETTLEVADFANVTIPEDAVKSPGDVAVPDAVAQLTWSGQQTFGGGATWIVNDAVALAPVPSVTVASEIVTEGVGAASAGEGRERMSTVAATAPATSRTSANEARGRRRGKPGSIGGQSAVPDDRRIPVLRAICCPGEGMDVRRIVRRPVGRSGGAAAR